MKKWRTILGLILVYAAVFMNWQWLWGILFLVWVIPDIISGFTYFLEPVSKKENPILFWFIMLSWLLMSAYMIATAFVPQLQMADYGNYGSSIYASESIGVYEEKSSLNKKAIAPKPTHQKTTAKETAKPTDTPLQYKALAAKESHFIGIPIQTSYKNEAYLTALQEAWTYFGKEDISAAIPNIIEERVYAIYTNYNQPQQDDVTILLGYKTSDIQQVYEGLMGVTVPATDFAVLENKGKPTEQFLTDTWAKVLQSDLKRSELADMEVYQLHPQTGAVEKAELRIALDTGKKTGQIVTKMGSKQSKPTTTAKSSHPTSKSSPIEAKKQPTKPSSSKIIQPSPASSKPEVTKRETPTPTAPSPKLTPPKTPETKPVPQPKKLNYRTEKAGVQHFVGISAVTTADNAHLEPTLKELWDYFLQNDISQAISNIVDDKVYVVYSNYDQPKKGEVKVTLGYKTSDTKNVYEGLTGVSTPATTFAVFESRTNPEQFVKESWEKVFSTNINRTNTVDLEEYTIHPTTYEIEQVKLKVAIQ